MKYLAGYPNFMDWYLVPKTPENAQEYTDFGCDEYNTFSEAKASLIKQLKQRIEDDRQALKLIRKLRKSK